MNELPVFVIPVKTGIHLRPNMELSGCPIKELGQKVNTACGREATLGYDGNYNHELL